MAVSRLLTSCECVDTIETSWVSFSGLVTRRSGSGRSAAARLDHQPVSFIARHLALVGVVLGKLDRAFCLLQSLGIFLLLVQGQRQAQDHHGIGVCRISVNRLA